MTDLSSVLPQLRTRRAAATGWPGWVVPQLEAATDVADRASADPHHPPLATALYRDWFNPVITSVATGPRRSLAGLYRSAHAGSRTRVASDGVWVLDRHDVVGRDGWWRTWNAAWLPTRSRAGATRILFAPTPTADALGEFVATITSQLRGSPNPWLLACASDPRRLRRMSSAVLYLPAGDVPAELVAAVAPMVLPDTPPLCLRLGAGVALAEYPTNGMGFGEHRCHLVARALRTSAARRDPLRAIASAFSAHGLDPAAPHLAARGDRRAA